MVRTGHDRGQRDRRVLGAVDVGNWSSYASVIEKMGQIGAAPAASDCKRGPGARVAQYFDRG